MPYSLSWLTCPKSRVIGDHDCPEHSRSSTAPTSAFDRQIWNMGTKSYHELVDLRIKLPHIPQSHQYCTSLQCTMNQFSKTVKRTIFLNIIFIHLTESNIHTRIPKAYTSDAGKMRLCWLVSGAWYMHVKILEALVWFYLSTAGKVFYRPPP